MPNHRTLIYRYVGMATQEVIGDQNTINVVLESDVMQMDEVVVTALVFAEKEIPKQLMQEVSRRELQHH